MDTSPNGQAGSVVQLEAALAEIPDIDAFHVVGNGHGVEEVHIVTSSRKPAKQIVRDIESVLLAKHKLTIDRKKISIATLGGRVSPLPSRPKITSVVTNSGSDVSKIDVVLHAGENEYVGTASGPQSKSWTKRLVAQATIDAVTKLSKQAIAFALEDATIVTLSRERVALVVLSIVGHGSEQAHCGTAIVRNDEKDAIVRATLDAVNRRIGFLTTT